MLEVLKEERQTRLKLVPVERPMSPEELRQFAQGNAIEPGPSAPSIADNGQEPTDFVLCRSRGVRVPLPAAFEDVALRGDAVAELTRMVLPEDRGESMSQSSVMNCRAPSTDTTAESASLASAEPQAQHVVPPAATEVALASQPSDTTDGNIASRLTPDALPRTRARRATLRWRVLLL